MKKNYKTKGHPMDSVIATVRKTVDFAVANPETFRPGTESYAFYENMSGICTTGLEHFTDMASARPLLEILRLFAETDRPEAKVLYGSYLAKEEKPWYDPIVAKMMLMHALSDIEEDPSNPHAAEIMCIYGLHVLEGRGWFQRDAARGRLYITRAANMGSKEAARFLPLLDAMEKGAEAR